MSNIGHPVVAPGFAATNEILSQYILTLDIIFEAPFSLGQNYLSHNCFQRLVKI